MEWTNGMKGKFLRGQFLIAFLPSERPLSIIPEYLFSKVEAVVPTWSAISL